LKLNTLKTCFLIQTLCFLIACGGGGSSTTVATGSENNTNFSSGSSWTIGTSSHQGSMIASTQSIDDGRVVIVISTAGANPNSSEYAGSTITIQALALGTGDYALIDSVGELLRIQSESPETPVAYIRAQAGTVHVNPLASTSWQSVTGTVSVVVDGDGHYRFSTNEPSTFTRELDLGTGIPGAPDQIDVSLTNVYGAGM